MGSVQGQSLQTTGFSTVVRLRNDSLYGRETTGG